VRAPRRACRCGRLVPCPVHAARPWAGSRRASRQVRGYGRDHERLRLVVLAEEPVCRACGRAPSTVSDHVLPLSLGGTTVRENLQGLCPPCSREKSAREGRQAQLTAKARLRGSVARVMANSEWAVPNFSRPLPEDRPSPVFQRSLKSRGRT
jgi:5-methylcytosine-specific restriction protein A